MARRNNGADAALRDHLLALLRGGHAHATFDDVLKGLPASLRARAPRGLPYSAWQILEHMRIAQRDILEFSRNRNYESPKWPQGYWPEEKKPSESAWRRSVTEFRADLKAMEDLVADPTTDLFAPVAWGDGQTILREALLVADHNAYHLGELVVLRRALGAWPR